MAQCQQCGRAANFQRRSPAKYKGPKRKTPTIGRTDHDLCQRCWRKLMDSLTPPK